MFQELNGKDVRSDLRLLRVLMMPWERKLVMEEAHDRQAGHRAESATLEKVVSKYWWPKMREEVQKYVRTCDGCQRYSRERLEEPLKLVEVPEVFQKVHMDLIGPFIESGKKKLVIIARDYLTGWVEARAIPNKTKQQVVNFLISEIFTRHGVPREIVTDRGGEFINDAVKELCDQFGIVKIATSAYHQQANGIVERGHQ